MQARPRGVEANQQPPPPQTPIGGGISPDQAAVVQALLQQQQMLQTMTGRGHLNMPPSVPGRPWVDRSPEPGDEGPAIVTRALDMPPMELGRAPRAGSGLAGFIQSRGKHRF